MERGILNFVLEKGLTRLFIGDLGLTVALLCSFTLT